MKNLASTLALITLTVFAFASVAQADEADTYLDCIKNSFKGSHSFSAEDVRSLCLEISGTQDTIYTWTEEKMIPSNDFTECYDSEVKKLVPLGKKRSAEVAKIVCRYEAR